MQVNCISSSKGKINLIMALLLTSILMFGTTLAEASAEGEAMFQQNCAGCHTVGGGDKIGPDLQGITGRRDRDWLEKYIINPAEMKAKGDPAALELAKNWNITMPTLGISADITRSIVAFLGAGTGSGAAAPVETQPLPQGKATLGRDLYQGVISFKNGGGACIACHNAGNTGSLGGGSLGPDLTEVYNRYGEAGLVAVLSTAPSPFPTMKPVYNSRPLTQAEATHLAAFLATTAGEQVAATGIKFAVTGLGGAVLLLALCAMIWRNRLRNVRQSLVEQAKNRAA